jgi:hypothetical protein
MDGSVEAWLGAAEHARTRARRASEHAAKARDPESAFRFEIAASPALAAAECCENTAISTFKTGQLELLLTRRTVRSLS